MSVPSASGSIPHATATAAPPAAPAAGALRRIRVPRRAEHRVEGLRAGAELGGVGLADDDRARRPHPFDVERVLVGDEVAVDGGAERGPHPPGRGEVLDCDRQPLERARRLAPREGRVRRAGAFEGRLRVQGDDRVHGRVHLLDAGEEPAHELLGTELAGGDAAHEIAGRREHDVGVRGKGVGCCVHAASSGPKLAAGVVRSVVPIDCGGPRPPGSAREIGVRVGFRFRKPTLTPISRRLPACAPGEVGRPTPGFVRNRVRIAKKTVRARLDLIHVISVGG